MRYIFLALTLLASLNAFPQTINRLLSTDKILELRKKAIFKIAMYDNSGKHISNGTGFFIKKDGTAITNFHVLYHANNKTLFSNSNDTKYLNMNYLLKSSNFQYKITDMNGKDIEGGAPKVLGCGNENNIDACLLKFDLKKTPYIPIDNVKVGKGNKVHSIGYCNGLNTKNGEIKEYFKDFLTLKNITNINYNLKTKMIQVTNPVCPGDSGGPIFSANGDLVGMTTIRFKNELAEADDSDDRWFYLGILIGETKQIKRITPFQLTLFKGIDPKKVTRPSDPFKIP